MATSPTDRELVSLSERWKRLRAWQQILLAIIATVAAVVAGVSQVIVVQGLPLRVERLEHHAARDTIRLQALEDEIDENHDVLRRVESRQHEILDAVVEILCRADHSAEQCAADALTRGGA